MQLLLDSADPTAWRRHAGSGIYRGVTTNPLLLQAAGIPCNLERLAGLADEVRQLGFGEIHIQAWGEPLEETATRIAALGDHVYVKLPATRSGFAAARALGLPRRTTMTAIHTAEQVLAAAAADAAYAAPYYARLLEAGRNADDIFDAMLQIDAPRTRLLVASLRNPAQLVDLARRGFDCFAVQLPVADALLDSDLTDAAVLAFETAARNR